MGSAHRQRSIELRDATVDRPAGRFVFVLLCVIPFIATIAFGSVDVWALGVLAVFTAALLFGWFAGALRGDELTFNTNLIQLPLIAMLLIGVVQIVPFWAPPPADLIADGDRQAMSLDPYATRLFLLRLCMQIVF